MEEYKQLFCKVNLNKDYYNLCLLRILGIIFASNITDKHELYDVIHEVFQDIEEIHLDSIEEIIKDLKNKAIEVISNIK
jgi:hypothetical protein